MAEAVLPQALMGLVAHLFMSSHFHAAIESPLLPDKLCQNCRVRSTHTIPHEPVSWLVADRIGVL